MKRTLTIGAIAVVSSFVFAVTLANTLAELLGQRPRCRNCNAAR